MSGKILAVLLTLLSVVYLLNPTAGFFELIPDNIPFIGNIDEGVAAFVLFKSVKYYRTGKWKLFE